MKDYRRRLSSVNKANRHDWYRISNSTGDTARVEIYDFIGYDPWWDEGVDAKKLAAVFERDGPGGVEPSSS
jgi:hypothetical protein